MNLKQLSTLQSFKHQVLWEPNEAAVGLLESVHCWGALCWPVELQLEEVQLSAAALWKTIEASVSFVERNMRNTQIPWKKALGNGPQTNYRVRTASKGVVWESHAQCAACLRSWSWWEVNCRESVAVAANKKVTSFPNSPAQPQTFKHHYLKDQE